MTVLHLGCGLDCRNSRVRRREDVLWVDLDRPRVVNLRERVLEQTPGDYILQNLDVSQEGWWKNIPASRPTLIVGRIPLFVSFKEKGANVVINQQLAEGLFPL